MNRALIIVFALALPAPSALAADSAPSDARLELALGAQAEYDSAVALSTTDPEKASALFLDSARGFQRAIDSGAATAAIYYNLGNAWVQAGEPARGVGAYLHALRIAPGHSETEANLAHARTLLRAASGPNDATALGRMTGLWQGIPRETRVIVATTLWIALWFGILAGAWIRWRRPIPWRSGLVFVGIAWTLVALTLAVDEYRLRSEVPGVVVARDVIVRKGNGDGFAPAFTQSVPVGSEFTLVEERPGWYSIRLADGQAGWVRASDAVLARERDGAS